MAWLLLLRQRHALRAVRPHRVRPPGTPPRQLNDVTAVNFWSGYCNFVNGMLFRRAVRPHLLWPTGAPRTQLNVVTTVALLNLCVATAPSSRKASSRGPTPPPKADGDATDATLLRHRRRACKVCSVYCPFLNCTGLVYALFSTPLVFVASGE